jgi:Spy/CpxP family protein refolding chaperone
VRSLVLAVAAVLSLNAAVAADPADKCPPRPGFAMIAPEQRLMMFADMKAQADTGAVDIQILRQMQRDKLRAMSADQRKAYFTGLSKRWAALTPARQKELKTEADAWRAAHPRPEGGRPGCPHPEH